MRTTPTLLLITTTLGLAQAQVPVSFDLTFDPGSDIVIDSLYPAGSGWQIGDPDKPVFDSAYSAPNALVTDTAAPYGVGPISYAEFHIPINFFGEGIFLSFEHRMDVDSAEAYGWVEYYDHYAEAWLRLDAGAWWVGGEIMYAGTTGLDTDSGMVFTGTDLSWSHSEFDMWCIAVLANEGERGGGIDTTMNFRFAFHGLQNTQARDGWLIDNVHLVNYGCSGGMEEHGDPTITLLPNPANNYAEIKLTGATGLEEVELISMDGRSIRTDRVAASPVPVLDVSGLMSGPYILRARTDAGVLIGKLLVQH